MKNYKCDVCGRELFKKKSLKGYCLCSKHMHQLHNYGKFLDSNPRTQNDLNNFEIKDDYVVFDLYDGKNSNKIGEFIIDREDLHKVKFHKWRFSHSHIVTGLPSKGTQRELSWVIMDLDNRIKENKNIVIDHIDGNPTNNRKSNLRICKQSQNVINKSFMSNNTSGFIGVNYDKKRNRYDPEIRLDNKRCHLGYTKNFEDAVYKRLVAENLLFGEYANKQEQQNKIEFTKNIPNETKKELENVVYNKLKLKNFTFGN